MSLSSNYLYHFTDEAWKLKSILENGIRVSYSLEDFSFLEETLDIDFQRLRRYLSSSKNSQKKVKTSDSTGEQFELAVPMACFCDIPLSLIERHSNIYGGYAVGLKKEWGIKRGMNPISYVAKESDMAAALQSFNSLTRRTSKDYEEYRYRNIFTKIIQLTKPYKGPYRHDSRTWEKYRFYDEREWRYIEKGDSTTLLSESQFDELRDQDKITRQLGFDPNDVEYIIVRHSEEKKEFMKWFKRNNESDDVYVKSVSEI